MGEALERLVRDGALRATLGAEARRRVAPYGWERVCRRYLEHARAS